MEKIFTRNRKGNTKMINEVKELGREELQDEILHILFKYLINENNEKDKLIRSLWNERKKENDRDRRTRLQKID